MKLRKEDDESFFERIDLDNVNKSDLLYLENFFTKIETNVFSLTCYKNDTKYHMYKLKDDYWIFFKGLDECYDLDSIDELVEVINKK